MQIGARIAEQIVTRTIPARDREAVLGDLHEEAPTPENGASVGQVWQIWECLRIATHFHVEPYREFDDRVRILAMSLAGLALLWLVPEATSRVFADLELYPDGFSRMIAATWGASHVTSAAAVGLLVGRASRLPEHCALARWHVGIILSVMAAVISHGPAAAVLAATTLIVSTWLGNHARRAVEMPRSPEQTVANRLTRR